MFRKKERGSVSMGVSTYHIHNVLRTYSKKLSKIRQWSTKKGVGEPKAKDWIRISARTRRKAVIDKVSSDIVNRIIRKSPRNDDKPGVSRQSQDENGNGHSLKKEDSKLIYQIIDKEKGKVTKTFNIEDSEFLTDRPEEITESRANH
jgi:hypothetical protein